jgi:hypothetical protein
MPYESQAQAGFFHEHPEKVGGEKVVKEWDAATKGKHLPERKHMKHKNKHGMKHTHITHHPDGSHTVEHGMHEGEPQTSAKVNDADLMSHMQEALAGPAEAAPAPAAPETA